MDDALARFVATHDARCPRCAYALRGATSDACPECGAALVLALQARPTADAAWTTMLIALALLAGIGLRRWVLELTSDLPSLDLAVHLPIPWLIVHAGILAAPLVLIASLLGRRRAQRWRPAARWAIAAAALLIFAGECRSLL